MAPPGAGKTVMACKTAVRRPVHVLDIDRKINAMSDMLPNDVTSWELKETFAEENILERIKQIATNANPGKEPLGWPKFAKMVADLSKMPESKEAGTWFLDSGTMLEGHLMRSILYYDKVGTAAFSPREWQYYLLMWTETIQALIDEASMYDKDLIISIHEREKDRPRPGTTVLHSKGKDGNKMREFIGALDLAIVPAIGGQFSDNIGRFFSDVYALKVKVDNAGVPTWTCRVWPDGQRDLRCSFPVTKGDWEPDFRKIWSAK